MATLQTCGIDTSASSLVLHRLNVSSEMYEIQTNRLDFARNLWGSRKNVNGADIFEQLHGKDVPVFTANDIMAILPSTIKIKGIEHSLFIGKKMVSDVPVYVASYSFVDDTGRFLAKVDDCCWESAIFIQTLYKALLWCATNNFIKPIKQETEQQ